MNCWNKNHNTAELQQNLGIKELLHKCVFMMDRYKTITGISVDYHKCITIYST